MSQSKYGSSVSKAMEMGLTQAQADALVAGIIATDRAAREAKASGVYEGWRVVNFVAPAKSGVVSAKYHHEGGKSEGTKETRRIVDIGTAPRIGETVAYSTERHGIELRRILAVYHTYAQNGGVWSTIVLARRAGDSSPAADATD
jgi:hypothetical protein